MKLRTRLAVSVVAAALPLAAAAVWAHQDMTRRRVAQVLREFAVTRMESGGRALCEADPAAFPPPQMRPARDLSLPPTPPPPPELGPVEAPGTAGADAQEVVTRFYAYDATLRSRNPAAPPVAAELATGVEAGEDVAVRRVRDGWEALVRMAWDEGPCALVLVRRTGPGLTGGVTDAVVPGMLVAAGVLVAVLLAAGSVVRRIRRLEEDVRRSAEAQYGGSVPVEGRDEVADLARAFDDAAAQVRAQIAEVESRESALREFVANTTHDVMTPLTVLAGHLDSLRPLVEAGTADERGALRDALAEVDYTTSLVANLATAAKLHAGGAALVRHAVELRSLVERIAARHRPLAAARQIEMNHAVPDAPVSGMADVTLLEQAAGNVVQNAIRYNHAGGHVALVLRAQAGRFELRIEDDGPGVPAEDLPRLTDRGFRGSTARTRSDTGRGLGLDITAEVCERLGFELAFAPAEAGGLLVTISGAAS